MQGVGIDDLRDLSRRSRRSQRWAFLGMFAGLVLVPAQLLLQAWWPAPWVALALLAVGGAIFVRYAFVAGEERGAFRRAFRRLADERRARTLVPDEAAPALRVEAK